MIRKALSLSFATALFAIKIASAATFVVPNDRDLLRRADAIVVATAGKSVAQLNREGGIETVTSMTVEENIKGFVPALFEVHEPGGEYGGIITAIPGIPRFAEGDRMLLLLTRNPEQQWVVTEIVLGRFAFMRDRTGRQLLVRSEQEIVGWDPDGTPHREPRRDAAKFLDFVRAESRGARGSENYEVPSEPLVLDRKLTSNARLTANATAFTANSYTMDLGSGRGSRWAQFPSQVPMYTGTGSSQAAISATQSAIVTWDNDCPSNINYVNPGVDPCSPSCHTTGLKGADGMNTVLFERDLSSYGIGPFSCGSNSYSGTLGLGGVTVASGTNTIPNGEIFWSTQEADVEMNRGVMGCSFLVSSGNMNTGVTHEVGHTLGFRHSDQTRADNPSVPCSSDPTLECSQTAVMRSSVPNGINGALQQWDKNAAAAVYPGGSCTTPTPPPPPTVSSKTVRDLNKDGQSDVLWWNINSGATYVWYMNNGRRVSGTGLPNMGSNAWHLVAEADFNGDGYLDFVWRNFLTGNNVIWLMQNTTRLQQVSLPFAGTNWFIEATGDINGDGQPDIIWHDHQTGSGYVWLMAGATFVQGIGLQGAPPPWHIVGASDLNGDGGTDIVWRNGGTGQNAVWKLSGTTVVANMALPQVSDVNWQIVAVADYNNDGTADLFWRNVRTGDHEIWFIQNYSHVSSLTPDPERDTTWFIAGPR